MCYTELKGNVNSIQIAELPFYQQQSVNVNRTLNISFAAADAE